MNLEQNKVNYIQVEENMSETMNITTRLTQASLVAVSLVVYIILQSRDT